MNNQYCPFDKIIDIDIDIDTTLDAKVRG